MSLHFDLEVLILGIPSGDLADLSGPQLKAIDQMQMMTIKKENELSEKITKQQENIANSSMVELSHACSELVRSSGAGTMSHEGGDRRVDAALTAKEKLLGDVVREADRLRLRTLRGILDILTPIQGVHFLIAAAELHLRLHDWGKKKDAVGRAQDLALQSNNQEN